MDKMQSMKCFLLLALLILFLSTAACDSVVSSPTLVISRTPQPTILAGDLEKTSTRTPLPTFTPIPSLTPNLTQTEIAQEMITTRIAEQTLVAQYPSACEALFAGREISPNGLWMAELCYGDVNQDLTLTFSNRENKALWKLFYKDFMPQMDPMPDGGLSIARWTNDGQYAYFYSYVAGDGGECYFDGRGSGSGLFRIDLQTGYTSVVLPKGDLDKWYTFSFSPTDRRLVYGVSSRDLKILDIATQETLPVINVHTFSQSGGYLWSPDGLRFVYSTVTSLDNWETRSYSLRLVDATSGSEEMILESPDHCFATISWAKNNIVTIEEDYGQALIEFALSSRKIISEATTTPYP